MWEGVTKEKEEREREREIWVACLLPIHDLRTLASKKKVTKRYSKRVSLFRND